MNHPHGEDKQQPWQYYYLLLGALGVLGRKPITFSLNVLFALQIESALQWLCDKVQVISFYLPLIAKAIGLRTVSAVKKQYADRRSGSS